MTRDDVLRMAREAGVVADSPYLVPHDYQLNALERFAALVAAAVQAAFVEKAITAAEAAIDAAISMECEECAKVCDLFEEKADALNDSLADDDDRNEGRSEYVMGKAIAASRIASAIRARRQPTPTDSASTAS